MKVIAELMKEFDRSLLLVEKGSHREYVVCTDYDPKKPEGSQWIWGHYFDEDLPAALFFLKRSDTYYEVFEVLGDGSEQRYDDGWDFDMIKEDIDRLADMHPDRHWRAYAYREVGIAYER